MSKNNLRSFLFVPLFVGSWLIITVTACRNAAATTPPPSPLSLPTLTTIPSTLTTIATPVPSPSPTVTPLMATSVLTDGLKVVNYSGLELVGPIVVDEARGRIFVGAWADKEPKLAVIAAATGDLITTLDAHNTFGLDQNRGWLYVDNPHTGLSVIDTNTWKHLTTIKLPALSYNDLPPLVDTRTEQVLTFREEKVYIVNPETGTVSKSLPFIMYRSEYSGLPQGEPLPIYRSLLDSENRILYLFFNTYASGAGYLQDVMIVYDLDSHQEINRYGDSGVEYLPPSFATAFEGHLYLTRFKKSGYGGNADHSIWFEGQLQQTLSAEFSRFSASPLLVDTQRQLLYELAEGNIRVYALGTFRLLWIQKAPFGNDTSAFQISAYDSGTEQLYFLGNGSLAVWSTQNIQPPTPKRLINILLPSLPVNFLVVSPEWPDDKTLLGGWGMWYWEPPDRCGFVDDHDRFDRTWSYFLMSLDGAETWSRPQAGLDANCMLVTDVGFSSAYNRDHTLYINVVGKGAYQSTDSGELWQPTATEPNWLDILGDRYLLGRRFFFAERAILLPSLPNAKIESAQLVRHGTTFFLLARNTWLNNSDPKLNRGEIYRSFDGGNSWQLIALPANTIPTALAISPDFANDRLIFVGTAEGQVLLLDGVALESVP